MLLYATIKSFFMKGKYNFEADEIDLHGFHPQLRILLAINGIFFTNADSPLRLISPLFNTGTALVALGFEIIFLVRGVYLRDYSTATESFAYVMCLGTIPVVLASLYVNRDTIVELIDNMAKDFEYISKLGSKYRTVFLETQLLIWQGCYLWMSMTFCTAVLYVMNTVVLLLYQALFATEDDKTTRQLIFPMWLPKDDPYRTPNYEMFFVLQIAICFILVQAFCVYVYTMMHYLLHYYSIMDLMILDVLSLFEGLDESVMKLPKDHPSRTYTKHVLKVRVKRIVDWHNDVFNAIHKISSFYGPPLVYQVVFTSFGICLMAFQIANELDHGKFDFLFAALGISTIIQLWIPCYLGTLIREKGFAVGEACFFNGWQNTSLGEIVCRDLVIIIQRSQQPVIIDFPCLPTLSLETFSSIMSTSYTYFNMLRQSVQ